VRRVLLAAGAASLVLAAPAAAHVTVSPAFVAAYHTQRLVFASPNERQEPMTGFSVSVPNGFRIVTATHQPTWHPTVLGSKVTWSGGSLAPEKEVTFEVRVRGPSKPGAVQLKAEQLYPSGAVVRWPVAFTVVPGTQPSQHLGRAAIVALVGLLATILFVVVAWRRQRARLLRSG
jgi:uncharacterized protein YcnI